VVGAGAERVERAVLVFDGPRRETKTARGIRLAISELFEERGLGYRLKRITARPATEEDGLQVADMIAGAALDEATGHAHGYLARLAERVETVYVPQKENPPASWGCFYSGFEHLKPNPRPSVGHAFAGEETW